MHAKPSAMPADAHHRVLKAACKLFLANGFRVSMDEVAHEAKVSKQTVYAHFANKDGLFKAAVGALMQPLHAPLEAHPDLRSTLLAFAQAHQATSFQAPQVALGRMLIAEAPRFPLVARHLYQLALGQLQQRLAKCLAHGMEQGEIRQDDPAVAAEIFLAMLKGLEGDRRLFGIRGRSRKALADWAEHATELFLQAYAAGGRSSPTASTLPALV